MSEVAPHVFEKTNKELTNVIPLQVKNKCENSVTDISDVR